MLIRPLLVTLSLCSLIACSSSGGRAPVSDLSKGINYAQVPKRGAITSRTYKVQKGDTLYSIAWRSGVSMKTLKSQNNIKSDNLINVGQQLLIRAKAPSISNTASKNTNTTSKKTDPSAQKVNKNTAVRCVTQNCQKNKQKTLAPQKTKAYSSAKADKETAIKNIEKVKKVNKPKVDNNKVGGWSWPVQGKLTKNFSASSSSMQGISLVNVQGSLIHAAAAGEVVYAGSGLRGYGNLIIIKHNYDYLSAYAHNQTLLVRENDKIKKGQKIATMGDSGTDHVHLHFEIRYRGKSVDPLRYLPKR